MKTAHRHVVTLVFVLAATELQLAHGALILDQPLDPSAAGEFSNLGPANQQVADDFLLGDPTSLESLSWFGRYGDASVNPASPVAFSVRFFADASGSPSTLPLHELDVTVEAVASGSDFEGIPWFSYTLPLPSLVLAPGTYWVSVLENDPRTPFVGSTQWLWADTDTAGLRAIRSSDGVPWSASTDIDHAFTLKGTTVPEPTSAWLFTSAVLLLFVRRRSRSK